MTNAPIKIGNFAVSYNDSGEVFLSLANGPTIRVSDYYNQIVITSHGNVISPTAVNGLDAFRVRINK
jgi:hypothetical protein